MHIKGVNHCGVRVSATDLSVKHRNVEIDGIDIFYREAGVPGAPVVLLPHGYPSSSFQFRNFMPALADRWHLIAPDYPGFGYSGTPDRTRFAYTFDGYADFLERFTLAMNLTRYALYLHDYGSQIGLRLAMKAPERVTALIIQNGDIYEDELGPKYKALKDYWAKPTPEGREKLGEAVSEEGFRDEFVGEVAEHLIERISPDIWKLSWPLMREPQRREIMIGLMEGLRENLEWFPRYLSARAPAADADRLGTSGRLHARGRGAGISSGSAGRRASPARRRALGAGDQSRRDREAGVGFPRTGARVRILGSRPSS